MRVLVDGRFARSARRQGLFWVLGLCAPVPGPRQQILKYRLLEAGLGKPQIFESSYLTAAAAAAATDFRVGLTDGHGRGHGRGHGHRFSSRLN